MPDSLRWKDATTGQMWFLDLDPLCIPPGRTVGEDREGDDRLGDGGR